MTITVIDLFAGPGGLGEGFGSYRDNTDAPVFSLKASFEKEAVAHRTLSLRAFYRAFGHPSDVPGDYYRYLRGDRVSRNDLFSNPRYRTQVELAANEAHCIELGENKSLEIDSIISAALKEDHPWVLIGGPPCQVYSVVGRSRWRKKDVEAFEKDHRHFLYREYLRIIQKFRPAVFVMENVRGVLSSTHGGSPIFQKILEDLSEPANGLSYQIRSFNYPSDARIDNPMDFVVQAENHGLPQARHRVMLLGVRSDFSDRAHTPLKQVERISVSEAIGDLPKIRSQLSRGRDSIDGWSQVFSELLDIVSKGNSKDLGFIKGELESTGAGRSVPTSNGGRFIPGEPEISGAMPPSLAKWLHDERLGGYCEHEARAHMKGDLYRYLYAACYARAFGLSPKVDEFPNALLPNHENLWSEKIPFKDRFRVQVGHLPSTTVMSHISKDGHYYIHYDPAQCRSLTVREAARLQTFPDNYFFEGNRTEQFWQVGNAVPPYLARQVAESVAGLIHGAAAKVNSYPSF